MIAWFILIVVSLSVQVAWAAELGEMAGPDLVIRYDPALQHAAAGLARKFPLLKRETEEMLGLTLQAAPTVVLLKDGREFRDYVDNDLTTAFAVRGEDLIVIDYSKMDRNPFDLDATLKHELTHLLLKDIAVSGLPKWFDEGVAQWASGGIADIMNPGSEDVLRRAVLSGNLPDLKEIRRIFPNDPGGLILAYQASRSFVEYMTKEHGDAKLRAVLADMRGGKDLEQAVGDNLSTDLATIEQKWRRHLVRGYSWTAYVADRIYWLLFVFAALATFVGYLSFRRRMKAYRDEDEDSSAGNGPLSGQ